MASVAERLSRGFDRGERLRLAACYGSIALIHVIGWGVLLTYGVGHPAFLGLGGLAYTFGLRHAFDADHIAAIDSTTRKLLQQQHKPVSVGFFFSLGHSTVVFLIALALGLAVHAVVNGVATTTKSVANFVYNGIDQIGIDGAVKGVGAGAESGGRSLRTLQTGKVQQYAAVLFGAAALIALGLVLFT